MERNYSKGSGSESRKLFSEEKREKKQKNKKYF
jgi:hypothetical protein